MSIDRELLMSERDLPTVALAINQLTSAQAARWFVVVALTVAIVVLLVLERNVPTEVIGVYGLIVGSLFDTPASMSRRDKPPSN